MIDTLRAKTRFQTNATENSKSYFKANFKANFKDIRLILSLICVFLLVYIWISSFYQLDTAKTSALENARQDVNNYARTLEEHTLRTLQTADQASVFVADKYRSVGKSLDLASYLKSGVILGTTVVQVAVTDEKADLILSSLPFKAVNLADREHVQVHMQQDLKSIFISKPVLGKVSQKWSLQMTRRINRPDGSFDGVVIVSVDPEYFTRFYSDLKLGSDGLVTLIGADGIVRARRSGSQQDSGQDLSKGPAFQAALAHGSGDLISTSIVDGKKRFFAYRKVRDYPLYVFVAIGMEDALQEYTSRKNETLRLAILSSVLLLALFSFVIIMFGRLIDSRAKEVADSATKTRLMQDLSLQKQALRSSSERLDAILQNAADAIITTSKHGKIESFNHAAEVIFGFSCLEMMGQNLQQLIPDLQEKKLDTLMLKKFEINAVHQNGVVFPLEITCNAVTLAGSKKLILIARDITERRKVERLQQEFISTVSHELRTPLTSIRGSLGLIAGGVVGELPPKAAHLLHLAHTNTERLNHLINDLLDIQKMESGFLSLTMQAHGLPELIGDAIEVNQAFAQRLGLKIQLSGSIPEAMLNVDAGRFAQVMANLLSNACKYSSKGDQVEIVCDFVSERTFKHNSDRNTTQLSEHEEIVDFEDHIETPAKYIKIEVIDHGSGIPEQFKSRIFQKFSQADASDTRAKGGSGLGLSISQAIVHQMQGEIGFVSSAGQGTRFYVIFPLLFSQQT